MALGHRGGGRFASEGGDAAALRCSRAGDFTGAGREPYSGQGGGDAHVWAGRLGADRPQGKLALESGFTVGVGERPAALALAEVRRGGRGVPELTAERELRQLHEAAERPDDDDDTLPAARGSWSEAGWATALVVFSGRGHEYDLAARLRARGVRVVTLDTLAGGTAHDVLRNGLGRDVEARVRRGEFDVIFIATPCASYSVAHRPQLRARRRPWGVAAVPEAWRRYLAKHNELARFTARLIQAADAAGCAWALENPADRGDRDSPAWWEMHADHAPIWRLPAVRDAIAEAKGTIRTFAQCAFSAPWQKWTSLAHASCLSGVLGSLDQMRCDHGRERHESRAHGLAPDGTSRSSASAAYPPAMNEFLAEALASWARQAWEDRRRAATGRPASVPLVRQSGGRVADGASLSDDVAALCDDARHVAPRFASLRNRRAAAEATLRHEAMPGELHCSRAPTMPGAREAASHASRLEDQCRACEGDALRTMRAERMAQGPIAVAELYLDGVYESEITSWLRLADAAAARLKAGKAAPRVPSRVVGQHQMQPWARGVVWDCRDPAACVPVARSGRHTTFRGRRQLDRAALRRIAEELGWHDTDIVLQAGEGGVEVRSQCALETVLSFHHAGVGDAVEAASKVVAADWAEEWVDRPVRHLPFAPCRVLPRNVVMQERSRLVPGADGAAPTLELYEKPRVTQDSSDGGDNAVNAGVPESERYVVLPTVQQHARGLAICDTAGGSQHRAASYVVDAESAYRFCPVQEADLWTQCFAWWGEDGSVGFCVDRRLGFGGAFAPNRFERISTLVAAHVQAKQAAFDATQPVAPSVARWAAERRARQQRGELPQGEAQLAPRYIQVYIDDLTGAALDDPVATPSDVEGIDIDPGQVVSEGGLPALPGTRVYVHAQLAVLGLRDVGLNAAPSKVVVGDPVVALGLRVGRAAQRVDCPPLKRQSMLADIRQQRRTALVDMRVDRRRAQRLVGRLCNLSQVFPELKAVLHGGYAVTESTWETGGRRRRPPALQLAGRSEAQQAWVGLLDVAEELIDANDGVALAPERSFPPRDMPGMYTATTDASGVDGVGGYVFDAGAPEVVWLVSEAWPPDVLLALQAAAAVGGVQGTDSGSLSMPAAELFGSIAVPEAVAAAQGTAPVAVTAIGDCDPAVGAINANSSGNPQMRALLSGARSLTPQWLAVSVPREANLDADRLSHPAMWEEVEADARSAGLTPKWARITEESWAALRRAIGIGVQPQHSRRRRSKRRR